MTAALLILSLGAAGSPRAQVADPKAAFLQSLGQFSAGLDGTFGDEGPRVWSSLEALARGLDQWDATIRSYEVLMRSELQTAEPAMAVQMHLALGAVYLDRGRIEDALRELAAAARLDPNRPDVQTLLGLAYSQGANDPSSAADAFRRALALDPRDPVRAYVLGRHLMAMGERDEAHRVLRLAGERLPRPSGAAPAAPFLRLDLVPESAGVEPYFPPARYAEGFASIRRGEYERAIEQFREAAARDPLAAPSQPGAVAPPRPDVGEATSRAVAALRDGRPQDALPHLGAALALEPTSPELHRLLGHVHASDRQYAAAIEALETAVRLDPEDERARLALADVLAENGQPEAAEQALRETIEALPASGRARYALGRLHQRQGAYREAIGLLEDAVTFGPLLGLNDVYRTIGALEAARQNFDNALAAYLKRVDVHPNDADAHHALGDVYAKLGRHDEALAELAVALILNPAHTTAYATAAQVHLRNGSYQEATDASRHALSLDPRHMEARYVLATALLRMGNREEGVQELQVYQRLQAEDASAQARQFELGALRREAAVSTAGQDHETAVALLREAAILDPGAAVSHLDLGLALLRAGRPDDAIEPLTAAAARNAHFDVHRHLAEAYSAAGRMEESRRALATYEQMKQEAIRRAEAGR